ncbi:hypothetical protein DT065_05230 [Salicibibacter kimchii]|uniref:Uncharacterized protein n=1 Tax=Salicibibacter kimchii TaxID=2099786 RepID=A0A345BX01_9BACI|nr:hypothetical protein DT065_05230 [Salicibibacter kimchii]
MLYRAPSRIDLVCEGKIFLFLRDGSGGVRCRAIGQKSHGVPFCSGTVMGWFLTLRGPAFALSNLIKVACHSAINQGKELLKHAISTMLLPFNIAGYSHDVSTQEKQEQKALRRLRIAKKEP